MSHHYQIFSHSNRVNLPSLITCDKQSFLAKANSVKNGGWSSDIEWRFYINGSEINFDNFIMVNDKLVDIWPPKQQHVQQLEREPMEV